MDNYIFTRICLVIYSHLDIWILCCMEWDPGPTYVVQRLCDPGGSTYSSRSSVPTKLDKLGKSKSYVDYIHLPGLSSLPFLVTEKLNLAPNNHLGKLDPMGSFRYLRRLDRQV